jgi:hypothetical protein
MNPRRRHKAKARRAAWPCVPRYRAPGEWVEMRPSTALLVLPAYWHRRIQQGMSLGAGTVRIPRPALRGRDADSARAHSVR